MAGLDGRAWLLLTAGSFLVGLAKGGLSMVGMLSVPLLALVMSPVQAAAVLLPVYVTSDLFGLIAYRRRWDRRVLACLLPGAVAGVLLGWATARLVDDRQVGGVVGLIGVAFALLTLLRARSASASRQPDLARGSIWGALAGYTSFVSHSGAPPYQIFVQPLGLDAISYAGTTTVFFAIVNAVKLVPYAALGQFDLQTLKAAGAMVPVAGLGVWAGVWLVRRIPSEVFYRFITWALLAVSLKLMWDAWGRPLIG